MTSFDVDRVIVLVVIAVSIFVIWRKFIYGPVDDHGYNRMVGGLGNSPLSDEFREQCEKDWGIKYPPSHAMNHSNDQVDAIAYAIPSLPWREDYERMKRLRDYRVDQTPDDVLEIAGGGTGTILLCEDQSYNNHRVFFKDIKNFGRDDVCLCNYCHTPNRITNLSCDKCGAPLPIQ